MSRPRSARRGRQLRLVRLVVQLVIGVLVLTWAPAIAQAAFSSSTSARVVVGTYKIPAPTTARVTTDCQLLSSGMTVHVNDFSAVNRATSYTLTLTDQGGSELGAQTGTARTATFTVRKGLITSPTLTLRIRANVNTWTGEPLVVTVAC